MADVTGPISTLPGSYHTCPAGAMCDEHPDHLAVARIQGETDSFGSEMFDACQECIDELKRHKDGERVGCCDWCKSAATDLRYRRDYDEGMSGPVYLVCGPCVRKESQRASDELEEMGYYDYDDD